MNIKAHAISCKNGFLGFSFIDFKACNAADDGGDG